jgi:hypothetical protein
VPNTLANFRFTDTDKACLENDWLESVDTLNSIGEPRVIHMDGPCIPRIENRRDLLEAEKLLFPSNPDTYNWVRTICRNKDMFVDVALCLRWNDGDRFPPTIFIPLYVCQSPHDIHCLVGTIRKPRVPDFDMMDPHAQPDPDVFLTMYEFQDYFVGPQAIGSDADAELFVLESIFFTGDGVAIPIAPTGFERFVSGMLKPKNKNARSGSIPQLKQSVIDKLLEEYPWLKESDFSAKVDAAYRKGGGGGGGGGGHDPDKFMSLDDLDDIGREVLLDAMAELEAKRDELEDVTDNYEHFYYRVLGGKWTKAFKGVSSDSICAASRAHAVFWCDLYGLKPTKTYTFNTYGEFDCTMLAKEWVRRHEFFFLMFLADETWVNFQYSDADKASYEEPVEFAD